jgi:hypothetical protein
MGVKRLGILPQSGFYFNTVHRLVYSKRTAGRDAHFIEKGRPMDY